MVSGVCNAAGIHIQNSMLSKVIKIFDFIFIPNDYSFLIPSDVVRLKKYEGVMIMQNEFVDQKRIRHVKWINLYGTHSPHLKLGFHDNAQSGMLHSIWFSNEYKIL